MFRTFRRGDRPSQQDMASFDRAQLQVLRRLLTFVRPHWRRMVISIIALVFSAGLGLVLPLVVRSLVDVVLIETNRRLLNQIALGLLGVFILQAFFSFLNRYTLAYVGERVVADLRKLVYGHLQSLSLRFFSEQRTGAIVSRLTNDVSLLQETVTNNLVALLRQVITLIGGVFFLFWLDWQLTLVILAGIPIVTLTMVVLGRRIRRESRAVQDSLAEAANVLEETVSGIRIVKSFAQEEHEKGRFGGRVEETFQAAMRRTKIASVLGPLIGFMAFASITMTLWFGSMQVLSGRLTAGGLVAYLIYTMMVATPIATLAGLYTQFQNALGASERIFELLDTPPDIQNKPGAMNLPAIVGRVVFEGVRFQYHPDAPVLRDVSFAAEPGQVIALVGPSGAGKSTLINLISRFYDVDAGRICIDGHDIREVTVKTLRGQIGIVPQETLLFSESVADNIRYGRPEASLAEVEAAARAANAHHFITNDLSDGYATLVGERGVKLSGGQRQRVAIARAILKDPRILILDEATSSLDSESEHLVQEALERLMAGRTSFVIAHRLSTVRQADLILVLSEGRIVESGTHTELLQNEAGLYRYLYDRQFAADVTLPDTRVEVN